MTPILRLHYQYRDDADQVSSGSFDFSNPEKLGVKQAMSMLEPLLIGEVFFIPNRIGLPSLDVLRQASRDSLRSPGTSKDDRAFTRMTKDCEIRFLTVFFQREVSRHKSALSRLHIFLRW